MGFFIHIPHTLEPRIPKESESLFLAPLSERSSPFMVAHRHF
jgi:hypothetical protein